MDIELLKTFLEVNRTRHFGHAADNLYLTQSAVSARIRLLEETLSVVLFERQRNNLQLTSAGQRFLKHAKSIVSSWQLARQDVALDDQFTTSLAVAGLVDLWEMLLLDWLYEVRTAQEHVALHATAQPAEVINSQLLNHQIDLGFLFETQFSNDLEHRFVHRIELGLYASKPEQTLEQTLSKDFVMIDWGMAFARQFAGLFPDAAPASMTISHGSLAMSYLQRHGGSAYLPALWGDSASLHKVAEAPVIEREVYAVWRADNERLPVIHKVLSAFNTQKTN